MKNKGDFHLQKIFNQILQYSQDLTEINTDRLFQNWEDSKAYFIEMMGDNLMYTIPEKFVFTLSESEREHRLESFIGYLGTINPELSLFVEQQKNGFFQNLVESDYGKIHKGDKLIKAFKHFENDPVQLRTVQDKASMILMEDHIEGYFTVSVHPFDFLTLSDNNHHWTSCHNLKGDYRAGNLSYMTDQATVVCYFSNNKPEKLSNCPDDFEWFSKKWRCLLYFSDARDMVFASRQYPFDNKEMLDIVLKRLVPESGLFKSKDHWTGWNNNYIKNIQIDDFTHTYGKLIPLSNGIVSIQSLFTHTYTSNDLFYNDVLWSLSYEDPYYAYRLCGTSYYTDDGRKLNRVIPHINTRFSLGSSVRCLCCNEQLISHSQMVYCLHCLIDEIGYKEAKERYEDLFCSCDRCGAIFFDEDGFWVNDEDYICEDCAIEVPRCVDCNNLHDEDGTILYDDGECLCIWCQKDREEEDLEKEN